jgi:hypothetical protein
MTEIPFQAGKLQMLGLQTRLQTSTTRYTPPL